MIFVIRSRKGILYLWSSSRGSLMPTRTPGDNRPNPFAGQNAQFCLLENSENPAVILVNDFSGASAGTPPFPIKVDYNPDCIH